ncbi:ab-hydrolase associated lipase region [Colletotrichum karsti]|uniref:Ab-hydrolase associated lipase region n=1 Tax=Colletotrichum karsti TaxID=1095194 RepID=A0A9P6ICR7_9PEZI|nr:ab-hydrolase associated lipase region [Colletotrichum karsti]KAF9879446.1 ab-hydrolase associated lipase region [Colletotrichum karsti]
MPIPFIGRLNIVEYVALVGSFLLVGLEAIIRVLTLALPSPLIALFYRASRRLFNRFSTPAHKRAEERKKSISTNVRDASDFVDLCRLFGYEAEEHVTQTKDGFLLGLHRLAWKKGEEGLKINSGPNSVKKKVVYLHHGLLMNSEVWVCLTDEQRCLPFVLVEKGYDVWLGNNRGNKYSKKKVSQSPKSLEFWNFSIDEFAFHDIPDSIAYILEATDQESLSYIGFSQGTAQAFATLAIHPKLNQQVNVFIALAPAMSPAGLSNGIVDALVKASPQVLFLLFGRRSILSSATMWQSILYPPIFVRVIDLGLSFLFNWQTKNISLSQKLAAYPHLYSFTSTKSVVHWFQIIRNKSFQMYDDDVHPPMSISSSSKYTKVAKYPTRNIKTPIVLVYGGSDSLVDIKVMLKELPSQTVATEIPHYEHLDFLWGRDVDAQVFPHVFDALDSFTDALHSKEEYARYQLARQESLLGSGNAYRHAQKDSDVSASEASTSVDDIQPRNGTDSPLSYKSRDRPSGIPSPFGTTRTRAPYSQVVANDDDVPSSPDRPDSRAANPDDKGVETRESPTAKLKGIGVRRGSGGSSLSLDSMREGKGISLGTSKALGGVVTKSGIDAKGLGNAGTDEAKTVKKKKRVTVAP